MKRPTKQQTTNKIMYALIQKCIETLKVQNDMNILQNKINKEFLRVIKILLTLLALCCVIGLLNFFLLLLIYPTGVLK